MGAQVVRRSLPNSRLAERYFPVRVRAALPAGGFGSQLNAMYAWLDAGPGRSRHWVGSDAGAGMDATFFYFSDVAVAKAFIDQFPFLVLAVGPENDRPS